jgi:hypothetical protein
MITLNNYEEYLIDYLHGELSPAHIAEMELFLKDNPAIQEEYLMLRDTILVPDESIVFHDKTSLLKPIQVSFFHANKKYFAVAALVAGIVLSLFLWNEKKSTNPIELVHTNIQPIDTKDSTANQTLAQVDTMTTTPTMIQKNTTTVIAVKQSVIQKTKTTPIHQPTLYTPKKETIIAQVPQEKLIPVDIDPKENHDSITNTTVIAKTNDVKIEHPIQETMPSEPLTSANTPQHTIVLNTQKQPRLFNAIAQLARFSRNVKNKKNELAHTDFVVMLGNRKLINVNQN